MKKFLIGLVVLFVLAVGLPIVANAQSCKVQQRNVSRNYYNNDGYYNRNNRSYNRNRGSRVGNFVRNRNVRNIALATGGGALAGGLIGGNRKGILKGAIVGAGAGALYTYVLKPQKRGYR